MNEDTSESQPAARPPPTLKMIGDGLAEPAHVADDVWKLFRVGYVISIALGLLLVWRFTTGALIPFGIDASSALLLLAGIALVFIVSLSVFPMFALLPIMIVSWFPELAPTRESLGRGALFRYLARYGAVSLSYLVSVFAFTIILGIGPIFEPSLASNPVALYSIAFLLSIVLGVIVGIVSARLRRRLLDTDRGQDLGLLIGVSVGSYLWVWLVASSVGVVGIAIRIIPPDAGVWWLAAILVVIVLWHFMAVAVYMSGGYPAAVALGMALAALMLPFVSVGATTFRVLGMGGGIPISATVRVVDVPSGAFQIRRMQGCLVMWFGNQVSIQTPVDDSQQISNCHLSPLTPVEKPDGATVPTVVHTLARSDILDIYSLGRKLPP